jgi:hypothetical protein
MSSGSGESGWVEAFSSCSVWASGFGDSGDSMLIGVIVVLGETHTSENWRRHPDLDPQSQELLAEVVEAWGHIFESESMILLVPERLLNY